MNFLTDAGLLIATDKIHKITPPILDVDLEHYLEDSGDIKIAQLLKGIS